MGNNAIVNQFRGDEIAKVDNTLYPKVGGRLRLQLSQPRSRSAADSHRRDLHVDDRTI